MTRFLPLLSPLLCWLVAAIAPAVVCRAEAEAEGARALYELADIGSSARELARELATRAETYPGTLSAAARARLRAAVRAVANEQRARDIAREAFAASYDARAARAVEAWYRSEPGERILAMEVKAATTDWERDMPRFVDSLNGIVTPLERVKVLERLQRATAAAQDSVAMQVGIARILTTASQALLDPSQRASESEIEASLAAMQEESLHKMRMQLSIVFLFVYRDATTDNLARYAEFAETGPASWLFSANRQAMQALAERLEAELVTRLAGSHLEVAQ